MTTPQEILDLWFGPLPDHQTYPQAKSKLWFIKSEDTDKMLRDQFTEALTQAQAGGFQAWEADPRQRLALIILLDQFSRNIYRNDPRAFAADARALALAKDGIAKGMDRQLKLIERVFFYLPLEHDESMESQDLSIKVFEAVRAEAEGDFVPQADNFLDYAHQHRDVIVRFGRYPHRNKILGRADTEDEAAFLAKPGSGF